MPDRQRRNIEQLSLIVKPETNRRSPVAVPAPDPSPRFSEPAVVTLLIDGQAYSLGNGELADPAWTKDLLPMTNNGLATVIQCEDWIALSPAIRSDILALLGQYGDRFRLQIGAKQEPSTDPLMEILQSFQKSTDKQYLDQVKKLGLEAVRQLHADSPAVATEKLADILKAIGVRGVTATSLQKESEAETSTSTKKKGYSATDLAKSYITNLRAQQQLPDDAAPLRYFQGGYHEYAAGQWPELADSAMKAKITRFLQEIGHAAIGTRTVADVDQNIRGLTYLDCAKERMPFRVDQECPLAVSHPKLMVLQNGLIDLDSVLAGDPITPRPHDWHYFSLVKLPYKFDEKATCPLWLKTLGELLPEISPSDKRIEVLQEFMGWSLVPDDRQFDKFLILYGKGCNGKSTILKTWESLLGDDNVSHVALDDIAGEFRTHQMVGKLANIAGDMNQVDKVAEGKLKQLTSGDPIQVNRKHKEPITLYPTARLIFATNTLPAITDRSEGIWRRMIAMPFLEQISADKIDNQRGKSLQAELPGILNWALQGAIRLYRQGRFTECKTCESSVSDHRTDSDPFRQFVEEQCILRQDLWIYKKDLYAAYRGFCEENGRQGKNSSDFGKWVVDLQGVTRKRESTGDRKYIYQGINLTQNAQVAALQMRLGVPMPRGQLEAAQRTLAELTGAATEDKAKGPMPVDAQQADSQVGETNGQAKPAAPQAPSTQHQANSPAEGPAMRAGNPTPVSPKAQAIDKPVAAQLPQTVAAPDLPIPPNKDQGSSVASKDHHPSRSAQKANKGNATSENDSLSRSGPKDSGTAPPAPEK